MSLKNPNSLFVPRCHRTPLCWIHTSRSMLLASLFLRGDRILRCLVHPGIHLRRGNAIQSQITSSVTVTYYKPYERKLGTQRRETRGSSTAYRGCFSSPTAEIVPQYLDTLEQDRSRCGIFHDYGSTLYILHCSSGVLGSLKLR
jgi:hypothetical protein